MIWVEASKDLLQKKLFVCKTDTFVSFQRDVIVDYIITRVFIKQEKNWQDFMDIKYMNLALSLMLNVKEVLSQLL